MLSLSYTYNNTGTIASVTGLVNSVTVNEQYKYDPLQRLTNSTVTSQSTTTTLWYEYDNVGNRVRHSVNGIVTRYNYTYSNNRLANSTSTSAPNTRIYYAYDFNGNLLGQNVTTSATTRWAYTWDSRNYLLKATKEGANQGLYAYDGLGRLAESIESSTAFFAYRGTETLFKTISGSYSIDYLYAAGLRIATVDSSTGSYSTVKYFHVDHLGSTRLVTSSKKVALFSDSYQPFGQDNGTPTGSETYKFTGKPVSTTTGLYYYGARWYDASIGRFISPDPRPGRLSRPQSLNLYVYVRNSPLNLVDPWGEAECGFWDVGCHAGNVWNAGVNWWNSQDQTTKLAIIAVVATVAIVATAGLAAPALVPLIATGIALGAGSSVASYAAGTIASGGSISLKGLLTSAAIGGFFGAVSFGTYGAVAGAASAAGFGAISSFLVGAGASLAVSGAFRSVLNPQRTTGGPADLSSNVDTTIAKFQSYGGNRQQCSQASGLYTTLLVGGALVVHFSGYIHLAAVDAGSETGETIAWAGFGVGLAMIGAGIAVGYSACIA